MSAVLVSLIAVAGTLLGSLSTYLFQRRTARYAETTARMERLRQERLAACGAYATELTELKRGLITAWFGQRHQGDDVRSGRGAETDRLGAAAESARFRMLLVIDDADLSGVADAAFAAVGPLKTAADLDELREAERRFEAAVRTFVAAAGRLLR